VVEWLKHSRVRDDDEMPTVEAPPTQPETDEIDQAMVKAAIAEWRESKLYPGEGGTRFFDLACKLRDAGMPLGAIRTP